MMTFLLGTHQPHWLSHAGVPLFVSRRTLAPRRTFPRAAAPWALDSGGFTELSLRGAWSLSSAEYAAEVRRYRDEIGLLQWAAPQDWMCEPFVTAKTGLTVAEHQRRTVENYLELRALAPDVPFVPVLQGWSLGDYLRHIEDYDRAGIDLRALPLVGVGSVCRRQRETEGVAIVATIAAQGVCVHGFGFKTLGLRAAHRHLASADSLAWSFAARRQQIRLPGHSHKTCANCLEWALTWRHRLLRGLNHDRPQPIQLRLAV